MDARIERHERGGQGRSRPLPPFAIVSQSRDRRNQPSGQWNASEGL